MTIFTTLFAMIGITIIITSSEIFRNLRENVAKYSTFLGKLIECPMCMGFWVGFFFSLIGVGVESPLFLGSIVSLFSWSWYNIIDYFVIKGTWYASRIVTNPSEEKTEEITEEG